MAVMATILFVQVIARYLFGKSIYWAEELAVYSMIWGCFLSAAVGVAEKSHTRIAFFINLFPKAVVKVATVLVEAACAAFSVLLAYHSLSVVEITMKAVSAGLRIPMGVVYVSVTVSAALMALFCLMNIVEELRGFARPGERGEAAT